MRRLVLVALLCLALGYAEAAPLRGGTGIRAQLLWDVVADVDSYAIHCGTSTGTYTQSDDVGNVLYVRLIDTSLTFVRGTTYYCVVRAVDASIESEDSDEICFTWNGPNRRTTPC